MSEEIFLHFIEEPTNFKTKSWSVVNKNNFVLGQIKWYGPWRNYIFSTNAIILDTKCMNVIVRFIEEHKDDRN